MMDNMVQLKGRQASKQTNNTTVNQLKIKVSYLPIKAVRVFVL
jgi:hypothetical protein